MLFMLFNHLLYFYLLHYYNLLCFFSDMNYFVYFICLLCLTSLTTTMLDSYVSETLNNFIKTLVLFCKSLDLSVYSLHLGLYLWHVLFLYDSAFWSCYRSFRHPERGDWESVSGSVPLIHTRGWVGIRQRWEGVGQRGQKTD